MSGDGDRLTGLARVVPAAGWLRGYPGSWWRNDVLAGLTVTALLIPEGMAYAQLAGVGPEAAFYAAPAALLLYALLGTSRQLVVAVSSAVAITSAATVSLLATSGTAEYAALTAALALLAGLISVVAGVLRLGRIVQFFSSSVLLGFVFGLALIITMKQIPKILGLEVSEPDFFVGLWRTVTSLGDTSLVTLAVGAGCIVAMVALERWLPKLPAALVVLVGSIVVSALADLPDHGVAVVGVLPTGLAPPELPGVGWTAVPLLLSGAAGIALLAFAEATGPAEQLARKHGTEVDANRELVAIGASNMGAGLFQGFPIGASLSKTAANDRAGAHSPMSLVVAAAATALVALFLTPLFQDLPEAALAAIVVVAVSDMEKVGPLVRLWRLRRADCVVALVALAGVLVLDILPGLIIAVVVSLGLVVWRSGEARVAVLDRSASGMDVTAGTRAAEHTADGTGGAGAASALLVVRPQQMLFFVNAAQVRDAVIDAADARGDLDVVVLDLALTPDVDAPSCDALRDLAAVLAHRSTELWVVTGTDEASARLRAAGISDSMGPDLVFDDVSSALLAYLARHDTSGQDARAAVVGELLDLVHDRQRHPHLDERGRRALAGLEERLRCELDDPSTGREPSGGGAPGRGEA